MGQKYDALLCGIIIISHFKKSPKEIDCQETKPKQTPAVKAHAHNPLNTMLCFILNSIELWSFTQTRPGQNTPLLALQTAKLGLHIESVSLALGNAHIVEYKMKHWSMKK